MNIINKSSMEREPLFDIVIPLGPNDNSRINETIQNNKQNIIGYRNIYLIVFDPTISLEGCITINETIFPFSKSTIENYLGETPRVGWYLQQLLKLYAGTVIDGILENYLVIDADTAFLKPTTFFENKRPLYNTGDEYHDPYFKHMERLHPSLKKSNLNSGICHHMMFQRSKLIDLFHLVESHHSSMPFYRVFLKSIDWNERFSAGAAEYEIYFTYLHLYHPTSFYIRPLLWWQNTYNITFDTNASYDYISKHWYK